MRVHCGLRGELGFVPIRRRRLEVGVVRVALRRVARRAERDTAQELQHANRIVQIGLVDARLVQPRDARHAVQRPLRMMHERPAQTAIDNRSKIESRKAIAFQLDAGRQPEQVRQLPLRAERAEVTLRGGVAVGAGAHQRRVRLESPDLSAAMGREVGAGRCRVGIAARAYERCTNLRVPQWRRFRSGGLCGRQVREREGEKNCEN